MDRYEVLTAPLKLSGTGLEIAPYFYPLLDKARHDVRYVDCIDNDTIAKKAAENPGAIGREIPRIDWVWTPGKPLRSCIPADIVFDYCVATHVMEHVPDTIGWLNQILEVMRDGAVLALALPDRRYTMDHYRRETTLGDVVGNWISAPSRPTGAQIVDFLSQSFYDTRARRSEVRPQPALRGRAPALHGRAGPGIRRALAPRRQLPRRALHGVDADELRRRHVTRGRHGPDERRDFHAGRAQSRQRLGRVHRPPDQAGRAQDFASPALTNPTPLTSPPGDSATSRRGCCAPAEACPASFAARHGLAQGAVEIRRPTSRRYAHSAANDAAAISTSATSAAGCCW